MPNRKQPLYPHVPKSHMVTESKGRIKEGCPYCGAWPFDVNIKTTSFGEGTIDDDWVLDVDKMDEETEITCRKCGRKIDPQRIKWAGGK